MKTKSILIIILLLSLPASSFDFMHKPLRLRAGQPVPWEEIRKAILNPSSNAFEVSSFVMETFTLDPLPGGMGGSAVIPAPYQALAMLMGFQATPHRAGRWFHYLKGAQPLLDACTPEEREWYQKRLLHYRKVASDRLTKLSLVGKPVGDIHLLASWLYELDPTSPEKAMWRCQRRLLLEPRPCVPLRSREADAKLILMHSLPLFVQSSDGDAWFCLGFMEKNNRTVFTMLPCASITESSYFSFLDEKAPARSNMVILAWQDNWSILYVPRMTRAYNLSRSMLNSDDKEKE